MKICDGDQFGLKWPSKHRKKGFNSHILPILRQKRGKGEVPGVLRGVNVRL